MLSRALLSRLLTAISRFPAVALLGPRQVGKTTMAHSLATSLGAEALYLDLELSSDRAKLADAELYLSSHGDKLIVLDEIHRAPEIFQLLRGLIDRRRRAGFRASQFLLLGSASVDLLQQSSESLAGRITYLELPPFLLPEVRARGKYTLNRLWTRGGFPDSFLASSEAASLEWRRSFLWTYLERDIPAFGPRIPAETLHRFWQMLANDQGQLFNAARIATGLGVSGQTVMRYLDLMADLLLVRRLQPWDRNANKRLVRSPKAYVRDSGLVHALLAIPNFDQLMGHPVVGSSWEGFVIENILGCAPPGVKGWFYRTAGGAELDLVLEFPNGKLWGIEVKRSLNPAPAKGFHIACDDLKPVKRIVVYPGEEAYPIDAKTEAVPLATLLDRLLPPVKAPPLKSLKKKSRGVR